MKPRTFFLLVGTVGAGMVLTNMMRGRRREHEAQAEEDKQSHRGRKALAMLGVGALLTRANRRRQQEQEAHNKAK
jgi:hypothetical protein